MRKLIVFFSLLSSIPVFSQDFQWDIAPAAKITKGKGRLSLAFPDSAYWSIDIYTAANKFIINRSISEQKLATNKNRFHDLAPGLYNLKLNTVPVNNVLIEEGKLTRVRSGILDIPQDGDWELRNETKEKFLTSGNKRTKMILPTGSYQLGNGNNYQVITIRDILAKADSIPDMLEPVPVSNYWEMTDNRDLGENGEIKVELFPISALAVNIDPGEPVESNWDPGKLVFKMRIRSVPDKMEIDNTTSSSVSVPPGRYYVSINNFNVPGTVAVAKGKSTRIKAGFLKVTKNEHDVGFRIGYFTGQFGPVKANQQVVVLPLPFESYVFYLEKYKLTHDYPENYNYNEMHRYEVITKDRQLIVNGKKTNVYPGPGYLSYQY